MSDLGNQSQVISEYRGPRGFRWFVPGLLGGAPQPGIFDPVERDLEALQRVRCRLLVTLTEEWTPPADKINALEMRSIHQPIPDRHAPGIEETEGLCRIVADCIRQGEAVVYHCRAGKGRTGTMIAAQLIYDGLDADRAIRTIRTVNPQWIESDEQIDMLHRFREVTMRPLRLGSPLLKSAPELRI